MSLPDSCFMIHNSNKVVTRFAPSPTGTLHVGSARTALFNFLFSKQNNGEMILRIEDTDKERSKKRYEKDIIESLQWLGISHGGLFRQSERTDVYTKHIATLIEHNNAYIAEDGVIRFKNPNKKIVFRDLVRGDIVFDTTELKDFVIARSNIDPLYHLAVVIDDYEMGVTHVIRGEDHISNTPRQILIQEAIGAPRPAYVHIPLILSPDRSKLSTRHGAMSITEYKKEGYLPEALINFMALLGWSPPSAGRSLPTARRSPPSDLAEGMREKEIFTLEELVTLFSIKGVQKGGAVFNIEKLKWVNREHMKRLPEGRLKQEIEPYLPPEVKKMSESSRKAFLSVLVEKISVFSDIQNLYNAGEFSYFFEQPEYRKEELLWKDDSDFTVPQKHIDELMRILSQISTSKFTAAQIKESLWPYATEAGRGSVLWPFRYALSGKERSSDPFVIAEVLGKEETLRRLTYAQKKLSV